MQGMKVLGYSLSWVSVVPWHTRTPHAATSATATARASLIVVVLPPRPTAASMRERTTPRRSIEPEVRELARRRRTTTGTTTERHDAPHDGLCTQTEPNRQGRSGRGQAVGGGRRLDLKAKPTSSTALLLLVSKSDDSEHARVQRLGRAVSYPSRCLDKKDTMRARSSHHRSTRGTHSIALVLRQVLNLKDAAATVLCPVRFSERNQNAPRHWSGGREAICKIVKVVHWNVTRFKMVLLEGVATSTIGVCPETTTTTRSDSPPRYSPTRSIPPRPRLAPPPDQPPTPPVSSSAAGLASPYSGPTSASSATTSSRWSPESEEQARPYARSAAAVWELAGFDDSQTSCTEPGEKRDEEEQKHRTSERPREREGRGCDGGGEEKARQPQRILPEPEKKSFPDAISARCQTRRFYWATIPRGLVRSLGFDSRAGQIDALAVRGIANDLRTLTIEQEPETEEGEETYGRENGGRRRQCSGGQTRRAAKRSKCRAPGPGKTFDLGSGGVHTSNKKPASPSPGAPSRLGPLPLPCAWPVTPPRGSRPPWHFVRCLSPAVSNGNARGRFVCSPVAATAWGAARLTAPLYGHACGLNPAADDHSFPFVRRHAGGLAQRHDPGDRLELMQILAHVGGQAPLHHIRSNGCSLVFVEDRVELPPSAANFHAGRRQMQHGTPAVRLLTQI
nr:unnamed protein product [Digitaria exilis]